MCQQALAFVRSMYTCIYPGKYDSINLINKKKPSDANDSGGHVRYGDFVRIWAYSQYVEQVF